MLRCALPGPCPFPAASSLAEVQSKLAACRQQLAVQEEHLAELEARAKEEQVGPGGGGNSFLLGSKGKRGWAEGGAPGGAGGAEGGGAGGGAGGR